MNFASETGQVSELFNQILDSKKADPDIIFPKYEKIITNLKKELSVIKILHSTMHEIYKDRDFSDILNVIGSFQSELDQCVYNIKDICNNYETFKNIKSIQYSFMLCNVLSPYKKYFNDDSDDFNSFINTIIAGTYILPECMIDIKNIWYDYRTNDSVRKLIYTILRSLFKSSLEIFNVVISPDIDVKKFSEVLVASISDVQKNPELNRCKKAFEKIRNSVGLLENNFTEYYKDFVQSKDPSTIVQSFISDIVNDGNVDHECVIQFKIIIKYYHKMQNSGRIKDPKLLNVLDMISKKIEVVEDYQKSAAKEAAAETTTEVKDTSSNYENDSFLPKQRPNKSSKSVKK